MKARPLVKLEDRLIYTEVVEGLVRHGLGGQVSPRLRERLRHLGLDVDRPPPAFPVLAWQKCLHVIVEETFPGMPREEGFRRLAHRHVQGYGQTLIGKATLRVLRLLGPRRMVLRLPKVLSSTDNYTEGSAEERGPMEYTVSINSKQPLGYVEGLFESVLLACGAARPRVTLLEGSEEHSTFLLTWSEAP
ncbi:DUF2378 family protein [Hyalangium rubrum]|uniref:DUF2378 family protein n=1 Tax=Hyalangium rubrum TaxID=3103134 RepID=A0ABU5GXP4_9BACT|nr:DUF2378 family protein [Hyalangium sp. s54d21]MDY7225966.1 DUF2378 family protein [Hyalangium sp. s54d21]